MAEKQHELSRRGFLKSLGALAFAVAPANEALTGLEQDRLYQQHSGEIAPFTPKNKLKFTAEYAPQPSDEAPFTIAEVTAEVDLRKYHLFKALNVITESGTVTDLSGFIISQLKQVKYGESTYWSPDPGGVKGWVYDEIMGLYRVESDVPNWTPPHNRNWKIKEGHWPPKKGFWSSPAVFNVHNNYWIVEENGKKTLAYLPSEYDEYQKAFKALNNGNIPQAKGIAQARAGKFRLYGKFAPNGPAGLAGDETGPYLEATIVDKQVIPLDQENDIHQISGLIQDEDGNTLYALISCYPLDMTDGEQTTQRYVQWFKVKPVNIEDTGSSD